MVVPFPMSTTSSTKRRPALVVASWAFGGAHDYLLCLISTQNAPDPYIIPMDVGDVEGGSLARQSYIRPTYLFSADEALIAYRVGKLKEEKLQVVLERLVGLFTTA